MTTAEDEVWLENRTALPYRVTMCSKKLKSPSDASTSVYISVSTRHTYLHNLLSIFSWIHGRFRE